MDPNATNVPSVPAPAAPTTPPAPQNPIPHESVLSKILWPIVALVGICVIAAGAWYFFVGARVEKSAVSEKIVRIGLSLDSVKIQRWADERDVMIDKAAQLGATVTTFSAENDDATQIAQIENLINQKVDAIIVVAHDADAVGPVIKKAQDAGIKVINYDRLTRGSVPDLYLSFDSVKVGEIAAQYVVDEAMKKKAVPNIAYVAGSPTDNNTYLVSEGVMKIVDPLVKAGKVKLVYNEFTKDWSPSEAYTNFKKFLDGKGTADGVITAYDGLAYGVIQALTERKLEGSVPVSGQNGELQAIQRIVAGTQTVTAWKPGKPLAERAVEAAIDFATGREPATNGAVNNKTADVKAYLFEPIPVTKDNVRDTVIKSGTFTEAEVYGTSQ